MIKEKTHATTEGKSAEIRCYRCLELGHHQFECTKEQVCYKCREKGHMAADCAMTKRKIQPFGFGIPGQGFYSIDIPEPQVKYSQTTGVVQVLEGVADEEKINEELKLVINDKWDFQARKMFDNEYMVIFPDKGTLETFTRVANFRLSIHNLKVKIIKTLVDLNTSSVLKTCWVLISNIPPFAKEEAVVKEIATLVGQPLVVDELSLIREEPMRVKINCRDPLAIRCGIEIFFYKIGHTIKFVAEADKGRSLDPRGASKC